VSRVVQIVSRGDQRPQVLSLLGQITGILCERQVDQALMERFDAHQWCAVDDARLLSLPECARPRQRG